MEPRKKSLADEDRSDLANRPGLPSENFNVNDEENLDTRNVAHDIEEGDEDYDDEELEESDFDIDDDDDEEDDDDDDEAHPTFPVARPSRHTASLFDLIKKPSTILNIEGFSFIVIDHNFKLQTPNFKLFTPGGKAI